MRKTSTRDPKKMLAQSVQGRFDFYWIQTDKLGFQIGIPLRGIARNGCFRLRHFIARNCDKISIKGSHYIFGELRAIKLLFHLKINNFNCSTYKFMQQIQEWKYLCRY